MHTITNSKSAYFVDKKHTCPHYDVDNFYGFGYAVWRGARRVNCCNNSAVVLK